MNVISGPYADGFAEEEYELSLADGMQFFGYSREESIERLWGPKVFKEAENSHGLDYAYDESEGSVWDLLSVRATVSSGIKERGREDLVKKILEKYSTPQDSACLDYGCGIGRELAVAGHLGYNLIGVERGRTAEFSRWKLGNENLNFQIISEEGYDHIGKEILDVIMCFEYFEHDPDPEKRVEGFWDKLKPGGLLICNCRSFNPHDTGHLESNFKFQGMFEEHIAATGFECLYFPYNLPNIWNIAVWKKVEKGQGHYSGATTLAGNW